MQKPARWFLFLAMAGLVVAAADADTPALTYDAHFERPYAAGQKYAITATDTTRSSQKTETPDGQATRNNTFQRLSLEADVTIDKVDANQQPAAVTLTIVKLTRERNFGGPDDAANNVENLLPAGTTIREVTTDGAPGFVAANGKDIPDDAIVILHRTFGPSPMKDEVYGSAQPKKVGDTWPINTKAIPVDRLNPQAVDPEDLTGNVTLKAIEKIDGVPCALFEASLTTDKVSVGDVRPTEAKMTIEQDVALPLDPAKPAVASNSKSTLHVVVEQKPLGKGVIRTTLDNETSHEVTWTAR